MNKEKTLLLLIEDLKKEIEERDETIQKMQKRLDAQEMYGAEWIHSSNFMQAIADAKAVQKQYEEALREIAAIRTKYMKEVSSLIQNL